MRKLVLGYLPKDYHPDTHLVLGPWSYLKNQDLLFDGRAVYEPDPYNTTEEIKYDAYISNQFTEYVLDKLTMRLNKKNGSTYTKAFWRVMIISWLSTLVQITIERFRRIENLLEKYPDENFEVDLVEASSLNPFKNTKEFFDYGVFSLHFNEWLFSRILERFDNRLHIKWKAAPLKPSRNGRRIPSVSVRELLDRKINRFFPSSTVYGILFESPLCELILFLKSFKGNRHQKKGEALKHNLNVKLSVIRRIVDWDLVFSKTLPSSFLNVPKNLKRPKPRYLLIGQRFLYQADDAGKMKAALHNEVGSQIICAQHGSRYGTLEATPYISSAEYAYSAFITWGWSHQADYDWLNTIPLPTPFLLRKAKIRSNKLLFIGQDSSLINYRLDSSPQPADHLKIARELRNMISALEYYIRTNLLLRFYPYKSNFFDYYGYILTFNIDVKVNSQFCREDLYASRLLIIDHPGTAMHQRMAMNLPIICYWDPKMWGFCDQAKPFFRRLEDNGLLFTNGEAAAKKVNEIWEEVETWWSQPERQAAVRMWNWHYARADRKWRRKWFNALRNYHLARL